MIIRNLSRAAILVSGLLLAAASGGGGSGSGAYVPPPSGGPPAGGGAPGANLWGTKSGNVAIASWDYVLDVPYSTVAVKDEGSKVEVESVMDYWKPVAWSLSITRMQQPAAPATEAANRYLTRFQEKWETTAPVNRTFLGMPAASFGLHKPGGISYGHLLIATQGYCEYIVLAFADSFASADNLLEGINRNSRTMSGQMPRAQNCQ
jgi:hypothetical protein